jgi:hypothetical protein
MFTTTRISLHTSLRWLRRAMTMILILSNFATTMLADAAPIQADTQPSFPIRAAFYYPWFPEAWNQQGFNPFTIYNPSLGFYDASQTVTKQHIAAMQYGGIQAGIASWWGQGSRTDAHIPGLLQAAAGTDFRWSIYYENESQGDPSVSQLTNDLTYLRDKYGNDPSFLRINGKFVIFVYADGADACGMADRWKQANTVGAYVVLKVFSGYRTCASQLDSWHQYSPAVATDSQRGYSYAIAPGFWKKGDAVRLARDLNRWNQNVRDMVASGAPWQLVTTFNEWGEGTSVESAQEWATGSGYGAYLDALHNNGNGGQAQPTATTVPPTQTAQPSPTAIPPTQTSQPTATAIVLPTQTAQPSVTSVAPTPTSGATSVASPTAPAATVTSNPNTTPTSTSVPTFTASPIPSPTRTSTPITTGGDPIIAAAGDIACDPSDGSFNGGNGTTNNCRQKAVSDLFVGKNFSAVLALGDIQYEDGTSSKYLQSFDPSWGRAKNLIRPAVGNHEYLTAGASGYYNYFGTAAGDKTKGYYSYDIGAWHIIALNSNCSQVGGCGAGSPQEQWLKADLAAHPTMCTLAYWHHPRFSSGQHGSSTSYDAFWKALYAARAEIVLNGHDHDYERFALQSPSGAADPNGIQEFVVGTGGKNHYQFMSVQPNSVVRNPDTYGILKLTLHATSYDWQFVPEPGKTFTDSGTMNCRGTASTQPTPTQVSAPTSTAVSNPTNAAPTPTAIGTNLPAPTATQQLPPATGTITFNPAADAYVTAAIPNTNYGTSQMIRFDASPVVNGYLTFNVQGLGGSVASAKLRLYANSSSSVGCKVFSVPNVSWGERTITYNNAPALGVQIGTYGAIRSSTWIEIDVTALVTGNGTFSLAVSGT